jgi:hypothetical protein
LPRGLALRAAGFWLLTRLGFLLFSVSWVLLAPGTHHLADAFQQWAQWDAGWFLGIARHGYFSPQSTGFMPLYPLLIRLFGGTLASGLLVSSLSALVGFVYVARLAARELGGEEPASRTLLVLAAYPFAFFLFAPYTEATFLAAIAAALYYAREGAWGRAAIAAATAGLTRVTALALIIPIAWEVARRSGFRLPRHRRSLQILAVLSVPIALGLFAAYCWYRFGDPLLLAHAQQRYWGHRLAAPWTVAGLVIERLTVRHAYRELFDLVSWLGILLLTIAGARRLAPSLTLFQLGLLYLAVATPTVNDESAIYSAYRYLVPSVPAFMTLSGWCDGRPWLLGGLAGAGFLVQGLLCIDFLSGGPIH